LISETVTNTEDEISKTRQYETRRDQEVWAGSHDLPRSTGIQVSRSRELVTLWLGLPLVLCLLSGHHFLLWGPDSLLGDSVQC